MRSLGGKTLSWIAVVFSGTFSASAAMAGGDLSPAAREVNVAGGTLMIAAYIALWLLVFGYLAMIMRRQRTLSRDLVALERRMDEVLGTGQDSRPID
ncbi:MAG: hypothetical protein H0U74_06465 [Bradymonadaceae bacterium]|nr:hypothetical protein [Lujinxingiaceae bacterium]